MKKHKPATKRKPLPNRVRCIAKNKDGTRCARRGNWLIRAGTKANGPHGWGCLQHHDQDLRRRGQA